MRRPRSFRRPLLIAGGGLTTGAVVVGVVLVAEVVVAGRGPRVIEFDPRAADGLVGAAEGASGPVVDVAWLGDSTAAGVGASGPSEALAAQVARATGQPTRLTVPATSGARVAAVIEQAKGLPAGTDLVVISVGANDATHSVDTGTFRADYERVLQALPPGAGVVLLGVPDIGAATRLAMPLRQVAGAHGRRFDEVVRAVAADHGAGYVDIAGRTGPSFRSDPDRYLAADRYHPNDEGYRLWRDAIVPVVTDALAR